MRVLTLEGVGQNEPSVPLQNTRGYGRVPIHAVVEGDATFFLSGREGPQNEWQPLLQDVTADTIGTVPFRPFLQFRVTSGTGRVTLWISED
jgi:hypothetical protein